MKDITENNKNISINMTDEIRNKCVFSCRCLGKGYYKAVYSFCTNKRLYGRNFEKNWAW